MRHKFHAVQTILDGIKFPSKKQAAYYAQLKLRQRTGEVVFFMREVPFHLPGGIRYVVDFQVFLASGEVEFVDVKGVKTAMYILKKKQVEAIYPIKIKEV